MAQWFGPKEPGYELGIRSWQGWLALAIFLALLIGTRFIPFEALGLPGWSNNVAPLVIVLIFLPILYFNYERD